VVYQEDHQSRNISSKPIWLGLVMSANLTHEIRKYSQICKLLRQNFRDTKLALKELMQSDNYDSGRLKAWGYS
jgi:hypothetical protein